MLIVREGIEKFTENEGKYRHHRLKELSKFIPDLNDKDRAILECLTHFIYWAGKYPDPGSGREEDSVAIFELSEKYEISAKQLFELAARVMAYTQIVVNEEAYVSDGCT